MMKKYTIRLAPLILLLVLVAVKSYLIASDVTAYWRGPFLRLIAVDFDFLAILLLLSVARARLRSGKVRFLVCIVQILFCTMFLVDLALVLSVDSRFYYSDFLRFLPEWRVVLLYLSVENSLMMALLVLTTALPFRISTRAAMKLCGILMAVALVCRFVVPLPAGYEKYRNSIVTNHLQLFTRSTHRTRYSEDEIQKYVPRYQAAQSFYPLDTKPNIILLIVESLSTVDSRRSGGVRDWLPRYDALANKGVLFTNFVANHFASEGGLVSLLGGYPPLHFPTMSTDPHFEFGRQESVLGRYKQMGYYTEFLASNPIHFLNMEAFLREPGVAFEVYRGRDDVQRWKEVPRYTFDAPSDEALYQEVLLRLDELDTHPAPYFFAVFTTSSHTPWTDPLGRENTEENVWNYVDSHIERFVHRLEQSGFFEEGVLIVTADHRKMSRVTEEEMTMWGASAKARIALLIIGQGFEAGRVDPRFLQQADLLRFLGKLRSPEGALSQESIWVERYTQLWGDQTLAGQVEILQADDLGRESFPALVEANQITWLRRVPAQVKDLERRIHGQRALHQSVRESRFGSCKNALSPGRFSIGEHNGVRLQLYDIDQIPSKIPRMPKTEYELSEARIEPELKYQGVTDRFLARLTAFVNVREAGGYWIETRSAGPLCLYIDDEIVIDENTERGLGDLRAKILLSEGMHKLEILSFQSRKQKEFALFWVRPGEKEREVISSSQLYMPAS